MWLSIDTGYYLSDVDFSVKSESVYLQVVTLVTIFFKKVCNCKRLILLNDRLVMYQTHTPLRLPKQQYFRLFMI